MKFWLLLAITAVLLPYVECEEEDSEPILKVKFHDNCLGPDQIETDVCKDITKQCSARTEDDECQVVNELMQVITDSYEQKNAESFKWVNTFPKSLFATHCSETDSAECKFVSRNIVKKGWFSQLDALFVVLCVEPMDAPGPCTAFSDELSRVDKKMAHVFAKFCPSANLTVQDGCEKLVESCKDRAENNCQTYAKKLGTEKDKILNIISNYLKKGDVSALENKVKETCADEVMKDEICNDIILKFADYENTQVLSDVFSKVCPESTTKKFCEHLFPELAKKDKLSTMFNATCEARESRKRRKVDECSWYSGCTFTTSAVMESWKEENCQQYMKLCDQEPSAACSEINFRYRFLNNAEKFKEATTEVIETAIAVECGGESGSNARMETQCLLTVNLITLDKLDKLLKENALCSTKYSPNYKHYCMRIGLHFFQPSEKYSESEEGSIGYEYFMDFCMVTEERAFGEDSSCQMLKKACDIYAAESHPLAENAACQRVKQGFDKNAALSEMSEKDIVQSLDKQCTQQIEFNEETGLYNSEKLGPDCAMMARRIIEPLKKLEDKELAAKYQEICSFGTGANHAGCIIAHNIAAKWTEDSKTNKFFETNCVETLASAPPSCQLFGTLCSTNQRIAREKSKSLPEKMTACGRIERLFMLSDSTLTDLTNKTILESLNFHTKIMCDEEGEKEESCTKYINKILDNSKEDVVTAMVKICDDEELNTDPVQACNALLKGLYISGEIGPVVYLSTCVLGKETAAVSSPECKYHHNFCQEHKTTETCASVLKNEKLLKLHELVTAADDKSVSSAGQLLIEECDSKKDAKESSCEEFLKYLGDKEEILAQFVDNRVCFTKENKPNDACPKLTELAFPKYTKILQKTSDNCPISDEKIAQYQPCKSLNEYCSGHTDEPCFKRRYAHCTSVKDLNHCKSSAIVFCEGSTNEKCEKFYGFFMSDGFLRNHIENECLNEDTDLCRAFVKINAIKSDAAFAEKIFMKRCDNTSNRAVCKDIATLCKEQNTLSLCAKTKKRFCIVLDAVHCMGALTYLCKDGANTDCAESINAGMRDLDSSAYLMEQMCNNMTDGYKDACKQILDTALLKQHLGHGFESMCRSYDMSPGCLEVLKYCDQNSNQQCVGVKNYVEKLKANTGDVCTSLDDQCMTQLKKFCEQRPDEASCNHLFKSMDQSVYAKLYGQCVEGKLSSALCELQKQKMTEHAHTAHVFSQLCGGGAFLSAPCKALRDICKESSASCETVLGIYNMIRNICAGIIVLGLLMAISGGLILNYTNKQSHLELELKKEDQRQSFDSIMDKL